MHENIIRDNISIVLKQPRFPENIGAAARAMRNMGINQLILVDPEDFDLTKVLKLATHAAAEVVKKIKIYEDLREALSAYNYVIGTTARLGGQRQCVSSPSKIAETLVPISQKNRIAVVFGPEDRGLSNEDIRYCDVLANIPTADFSSLNLAQAVMVICYEIFIADRKENKEFVPRLASRREFEEMYDQLKEILVKISFINHENPDYWMNNFRRFFSRLRLRAKEVSIIRGICRQINWYGEKRYKDGLKENKASES